MCLSFFFFFFNFFLFIFFIVGLLLVWFCLFVGFFCWFFFVRFSVAVNFLYIFPWRGGGGKMAFCGLLSSCPSWHRFLYIYLKKKKRKKKCKEANERSLLHAWKLQEGREGRVLLECLTRVSLPPSHAHSPPPSPPPPPPARPLRAARERGPAGRGGESRGLGEATGRRAAQRM